MAKKKKKRRDRGITNARVEVEVDEYDLVLARTNHAEKNGGKPWRYLLIPHDEIKDQMTLAGLATLYEVRPK